MKFEEWEKNICECAVCLGTVEGINLTGSCGVCENWKPDIHWEMLLGSCKRKLGKWSYFDGCIVAFKRKEK